MDHFDYKNGRICAESIPLAHIAKAVGTPFYCYSTATIERHYRVFSQALEGLDSTICYAVKANGNTAVIRTLARLGAGADVVSGGELKRALVAGVPHDKIVFSGVAKTREELSAALDAGVMQINVESEAELAVLNQVAVARGVQAPVAIRVNPDVDAGTHEKITTGRTENKFGIEWTRVHQVYAKAAAMPGIRTSGVAVHIGSQITDLEPFRAAFIRVRDLVAMLRADGHAIGRIDLGGGLGIPYGEAGASGPVPTPAAYGRMVKDVVGDLGCHVLVEPGRVIVGNAGILVAKIVYIKEGSTRTFVIVDAAMNDLIRPTLYNAYHAIVPVAEPPADAVWKEVDVVGPVCETGDTFGSQRKLPPLEAGDLLAFRTAGAYGAVQASVYNSRSLVPEVLVRDGAFAVVRERINTDDILARETFPDWMD